MVLVQAEGDSLECDAGSQWAIAVNNVCAMYVPGSLSSIVTNAMSYGPISTALGWSVDIIITLKYSDSSVVPSSMVDTIKVADILPAVKVTVYGPLS